MFGLDEADRDAFAELEVRLALAPALDLEALRQSGERLLEIVHAQRDVLERAALPRTVRGEERELPAPRVGADERERVRPVDHVHPEMRNRKARDGVAIREPVGDVVEGLRVHGSGVPRCACDYSIGSFWTLFSTAYFSVSWFTTSAPLSYA